MKTKSIFVCGGDMRSVYIAEYFRKKGCKVDTFGHQNPDEDLNCVGSARVVILGLPATKGDEVYMPLSKEQISFSKLLKLCTPKTLVCGGRFTQREHLEAKKYNINLWDYSEDEVFQTENAFYTAEGALSRMIENTTMSVGKTKILVVGYGRIGKALISLMNSKLWDVTVYARRKEVCTELSVRGIKNIDNLCFLEKYHVIINTVPCNILDETALKATEDNALIMDLSARPGYVDKALCEKLNRRLMYLPGIPLWSAPQSAGISAAEAVERFAEGIE